jgi:3-phenylpropionate/trans-cinnamate dioxygenase ferredoxin reductase subunit
MELPKSIVIVGAGQAGFWAARTLRTQGYDGRLVLVGNEPHPPYERPPLSKQVLKGDAEPRSAWLATPEQLGELQIDVLSGQSAITIDRAGRVVRLDDGVEIAFDRLIIATGARPRRLDLPGERDSPVLYLRDMADCLAIRERLQRSGAREGLLGHGDRGRRAADGTRRRPRDQRLHAPPPCGTGDKNPHRQAARAV